MLPPLHALAATTAKRLTAAKSLPSAAKADAAVIAAMNAAEIAKTTAASARKIHAAKLLNNRPAVRFAHRARERYCF